MNKKMKSIQLTKPDDIKNNPLQLHEIETPEPGPEQILLKVNLCGVCHTDLHTVEGELNIPHQPITPGHQVVGIIERVGEAVSKHNVGDRVGVAWLNWTCSKCEFCQSGLENLCQNAQFTGLDAAGGYSEYMAVDERFAFPIPDVFVDSQAAPLLCSGIIGFRSLRLSGIQPGEKLGLYGFGSSAHLVIQVARYWDCEVFVFTRSPDHREHARELGAVWTGEAQDKPPARLNASITFAPAGWIIPHALSHLVPGGTLAINAIHMSPIPELPYQLIYDERTLRSVANFTKQDARDFLQIAAEIPIKSDVQIFPMQEANAVLQKLKASEIRGTAILSWQEGS